MTVEAEALRPTDECLGRFVSGLIIAVLVVHALMKLAPLKLAIDIMQGYAVVAASDQMLTGRES
jgi:hypothetical protein